MIFGDQNSALGYTKLQGRVKINLISFGLSILFILVTNSAFSRIHDDSTSVRNSSIIAYVEALFGKTGVIHK